ncbi:hypothetical protein CYY_000464 [Polysphondylium violaceum]|uniref:beta-ketoacyl-[acyl-carrier-protein] synthase I n=1 Tax=Polysphondylium violaceum TaxID=133409 RepID=A0A8J4Q3N9_9MYCE|nr:hypothetical protein CYY_000464 [Polysphondylium violaceum]
MLRYRKTLSLLVLSNQPWSRSTSTGAQYYTSTNVSGGSAHRRVVVTGMGLVTPLGVGLQHNWNSIVGGKSGLVSFDLVPDCPSKVVAMVPKGDGVGQFNDTSIPSSVKLASSDFIKYAIVASQEAINDAQLGPLLDSNADDIQERVGVIVGSGIGAMSDIVGTAEKVVTSTSNKSKSVSAYFIPRILINEVSGILSILHKAKGVNFSVVSACATGAHSIGESFRKIKYGEMDAMICGGTESAINSLSLLGFSRMRALSTKYNNDPTRASRPFDRDRDGFVMGEGAGILVLEEYQHAVNRGAKIYCEVTGYGATGDSGHISAPSADGDGPFRSMKLALKESGLSNTDIGYINAHATSTPQGDEIECLAVKKFFNNSTQPITLGSNKSSIGHLLGAAGSVESIFSILSLQNNIIPPTLNLENPCTPDIDFVANVSWIPRGAANPYPQKYDANEEELEDLNEDEINQKDISDEEKEEAATKDSKKKNKSGDDFMNRYNFDDYDEEDDEQGNMGEKGDMIEEVGLQFINRAMKGLMYYKDPDTDPHLQDNEEDVEDLEDILIRPTDSLLITAIATADDEYSHLDIMIYEEDCDNLYVHHDIILSSYPLALAWMDQNPTNAQEKGNFVAVGTFEPGIEIWNLDILDNLIPTVTLGQLEKEKGIKNKKTKLSTTSHTDSVMALSWNSQQRNILASGSSDKTIKVWDITTQQCLNSFTHHKDKIQALQWNPQEKTALLAGSFDKTASILDIRSPDAAYKWAMKSQVECLQWNPHNAKEFIVGSDNGLLRCFDATQGPTAQPLWSVQAHNQGISTFSICPGQPGFIATGSADQTLKLWKIDNNTPSLIQEKNLGEEIFSISFFQNSPYILAVGSEGQRPNIVNTKRFVSVQNSFGLEKPEGFDSEPSFVTRNKNNGEEDDDDEEEEEEEDEDEDFEEGEEGEEDDEESEEEN